MSGQMLRLPGSQFSLGGERPEQPAAVGFRAGAAIPLLEGAEAAGAAGTIVAFDAAGGEADGHATACCRRASPAKASSIVLGSRTKATLFVHQGERR